MQELNIRHIFASCASERVQRPLLSAARCVVVKEGAALSEGLVFSICTEVQDQVKGLMLG